MLKILILISPFILLYELFKIYRKRNLGWGEAFHSKKVYSYSDFFMKDFAKVKILHLLVFPVCLFSHLFILKIQTISFGVNFILLIFRPDKFEVVVGSALRNILWENPKILSFYAVMLLRNPQAFAKSGFKRLLANLSIRLFWGFSRFVINNCLIVTSNIVNWCSKSPRKKNIKEFISLLAYIEKNFFRELISANIP